jgi:Effector Associated Constant Component 1
MQVLIAVSGDDEIADMASLTQWLRADRDLQGTVRLVRAPVAEGELGGALDVVSVAVGSGGIGVALAQALSAWLSTRTPGLAKLKLTVTAGDRKAELTARGVSDPAAVIDQVRKIIDSSDDAGT